MACAIVYKGPAPVETGILTTIVHPPVIQIACDVKGFLTIAVSVSPGIGEGVVYLPAGQVV